MVIIINNFEVYIYICSKNKDQPGKFANPARGQLNREKIQGSSR